MIVNVACGDDVRAGMVNVDLRPTGQIVAEADRLPLRDGCADGVLALDILEHVPAARTDRLLGEWRRVLVDGGRLTVRVPNLQALAQALLDRPHMTDLLIRNIYGGRRFGPNGDWDAHHHGFVPATLHRDLVKTGWVVESNDNGLNMTVQAVAA